MTFIKTTLLASVAVLSATVFTQAPAFANDTKKMSPTHEQSAAAHEDRVVANADPQRVEKQISDLRTKLAITADQDGKWKDVADAMRTTAKEVRDKLGEHNDKDKDAGKDMTAVDELKSYQELQQIQYEGAKRLVGPFEKLYAALSDDQKQTADALFSSGREAAKASGGTAVRSKEKTVSN
jgi:hypothetical protein